MSESRAPAHVPGTLYPVPARSSRAIRLGAGETLRIVNTHGSQVVDTWAVAADDPAEVLSMQHTRAALLKLTPSQGDRLYSTRRRPLLCLAVDTTPGRHDTVIPACDKERYGQLGAPEGHANCCDNFALAIADAGLPDQPAPAPLNLFMNIPWTAEGALSFDPPLCKAGDRVELRAERDVVVVLSACPQDLVPINGADCVPTEVHYEILAG
ncbi:MAG: urea carboxylase-associated family protein [Alsobacter sp.]